MFDPQLLIQGLYLLLDWQLVPASVFGVFWGILFGAIPGLSAPVGMAVLLPLTINLDPLVALVLLLGVYTGGLWGGAVAAILINTPGSPAAVCTPLDGYPMARQGKAPEALGISLAASTLGGIAGIIALWVMIFPLAQMTLRFGPAEMFMLAVVGLTIIASLTTGDFLKGLLSAGFGMIVGLVGLSNMGTPRATFGVLQLADGIPLMPALIGLIAFTEVFSLLDREYISEHVDVGQLTIRRVWNGMLQTLHYPKTLIRSSLTGTFLGAMPAAGAAIAAIVSYSNAKRASRNPETFGKGNPEGLIAAESADNASEGGALATALALGIPGTGSTAILIGALVLQGWVPGPRLFSDHGDVVYASLIAIFLEQWLLMAMGILFAVFGAKIALIPTRVLIPCVTVFMIVGAYVERVYMFDAWLLLAFGLLGWVMQRTGYSPMAVVLGLVLGPIADAELVRIYQAFPQGIWVVFQRPISLVMFFMTVGLIAWPFVRAHRQKQFANAKNAKTTY